MADTVTIPRHDLDRLIDVVTLTLLIEQSNVVALNQARAGVPRSDSPNPEVIHLSRTMRRNMVRAVDAVRLSTGQPVARVEHIRGILTRVGESEQMLDAEFEDASNFQAENIRIASQEV